MADDKVSDPNATPPAAGGSLRGGTQGGEVARTLDPRAAEGGTPEVASAGSVHPPPPSRYVPVTGIDRPRPEAVMRGGTWREEVRRYLQGMSFPSLKHDVVHHARQTGASELIVVELERIPVTRFDSLDHVLDSYGEMEMSDVAGFPTESERERDRP